MGAWSNAIGALGMHLQLQEETALQAQVDSSGASTVLRKAISKPLVSEPPMFERLHHQRRAHVLQAMNGEVLAQHSCWFGRVLASH